MTYITINIAVYLWDTTSIYAHDEATDVDWQINSPNDVREAREVLNQVLANGCTLFID